MNKKIIGIVPTVERLDLVRQLVESYRSTWQLHIDAKVAALAEYPDSGVTATALTEMVTGAPPPLVFAVTGNDDATEGWCINQNFGVVRSKEVLPYAKAVNLAVKAGLETDPDTEWICLLNNDLILQPGFWAALDEMIAFGYEIIGSKLLYPNGTIQHFGKWLSLDGYPFHVLRYQPADHPMTLAPRPFPDVTFACVAIKREIWDDLGGLDEEYCNGYEDDDFCLKAREKGAQIGVHPGMLATHLEAQSTGIDSGNKATQWQRFNQIWIESGRWSWPVGIFPSWRQI